MLRQFGFVWAPVSPRVVNRLATPVLIVNTPIVISSKRQVLPHFHTRKYVIFAWFLIEFRRQILEQTPPHPTPQSKCPWYATDNDVKQLTAFTLKRPYIQHCVIYSHCSHACHAWQHRCSVFMYLLRTTDFKVIFYAYPLLNNYIIIYDYKIITFPPFVRIFYWFQWGRVITFTNLEKLVLRPINWYS